jgi:uncharacterized membrane protein YfcA
VSWQQGLLGFTAGLLISIVTAPVGISGAVFLLPVQLDVLHVPNPQVTPTNLLFNIIAGPGALARYHRHHQLTSPLTRQLITGTTPGVIIGAIVRVYLASGPTLFRILAAAVLLPLGIWLLTPTSTQRSDTPRRLAPRTVTVLALAIGIVGGVYGVGGGSLLGPILVGTGMTVATVAPGALLSTVVSSTIGALTYALLSVINSGAIVPNWPLGIACGLGGLIGGYLGALLQPHMPDTALRKTLGLLATGLAASYLINALT